MIRKTTWIVFGLFAILLVATLIWNAQQKKEAASTTPEATTVSTPLFSFSGDALAAIRLEDNTGRALDLWRDYSSNLWEIKEPATEATPDQAKIDSAAEQITSMTSLVALNPVTDFNPFGLGTPRYILTLTNLSGESNQVFIGDLTPTGNGYYVRVDTNAPVVVSKFSIDGITKLLDELPVSETSPTPTLPEPTGEMTPTLGTETPQP